MNINPFKMATLLNVLGFACICMVMWFFSPFVKISGHHIFSTVTARLVLVGMFIIVLLAAYIMSKIASYYASKRFFKYFDDNRDIRIFISNIPKMIKILMAELKEKGNSFDIRQIPWFITIGMPQAGKTTLIAKSENNLSRDMCKTHGLLNSLDSCTWWLSDRAIVLDMARYENNQQDNLNWNTEKNKELWGGILKYLKRHYLFHRAYPINGLILTYPIASCFQFNEMQIEEQRQVLNFRLNQMDLTIGQTYPIFIAMTKVDEIEGFTEFFSHCDDDEIKKALGFELPYQENCETIEKIVERKFDSFIEFLKNKSLIYLSKTNNLEVKKKIFDFPNQLASIKPLLMTSLKTTIWFNKRKSNLCGIYFTSVKQTSETCQLLDHTIYEKFGFEFEQKNLSLRNEKVYFAQGLFNKILDFEPNSRDQNLLTKLTKKAPFLFYALGLSVFISYCLALTRHYYVDSHRLKMTTNALQQFIKDSKVIEASDLNITAPVPALEKLEKAYDAYHEESLSDWLYHIGDISSLVKSQRELQETLHLAVHTLFFPRLVAYFHQQIEQKDNIDELEELLVSYMVFGKYDRITDEKVKTALARQWSKQYDKKTVVELNDIVDLLIASHIPDIDLDEQLILSSKQKINEVPLGERICNIIQETNTKSINVNQLLGNSFEKSFVILNNSNIIPSFYTKAASDTFFDSQLPSVAKKISGENWYIGLSQTNSLEEAVEKGTRETTNTYLERYASYWNKLIDNTHLISSDSLSEIIKQLKIIVSPDSPMLYYLSFIQSNNAPIAKTNPNSVALKKFMDNPKNFEDLRSKIEAVIKYLENIQLQSKTDEAAFNSIKLRMLGKLKDDPINDLYLTANTLPQPIQNWVISIISQCNEQLMSQAKHYINKLWATTVYNDYNEKLRDRYPINLEEKSEMTLEQFVSFFGPHGKINNFYEKYLQAFIDNSDSNWQWLSLNNIMFSQEPETLSFFRRSALITRSFFNAKSGSPQFEMTITPHSLDNQVASVSLNLPNSLITYRHGPIRSYTINWPDNSKVVPTTGSAEIIMSDFSSNQASYTTTGSWAIFRLFQHFGLKQRPTEGDFLLRAELKNMNASYVINSPAPSDLLTLKLFSELNIGPKLFDISN